ncbi:hypothetical protein [Levilactobacillus wangkuiensis]|uniref:hypothetical protein n=1 Tax=Levilactobacillus wangkuiensis TaxID=2799566 RepID=UPI001943E5B1|nr:hypothetical protein [Levilactobacillus wangkuiensis]
MKLHKLLAATLAAASLLGGTLATATPAMAKAKKFVYFSSDSPIHKQYKSMNKYTLNKTFAVKYSSKIKIKHLYVFHVSPMNSRYQTWVKVTGTIYDNGTSDIELSGQGLYDPITFLDTANAGKISAALDSSNFFGVASHSKQNFQLLYHIKDKTNKLGASKLTIRTVYDNSAYTSKKLKLNLN